MAKVGRNTPCPCGSGRKYKHCCVNDSPGIGEDDRVTEPLRMDHRAMERQLADIAGLMADREFSSIDETNSYLDDVLAGGDVPQPRFRPPGKRAQDLMYDAWEASGGERVSLARKALTVSEDCADAYVLLAEEAATTLDEALGLYRQGVAAGERALGPAPFSEDVGHFWGFLETRPYMRARLGLAHCLAKSGELAEAIEHAREMLRLNPGDNQGVRYPLLAFLLEAGRVESAEELLDRYPDDGTASWAYGRALLAFKRGDTTAASRRALGEAIKVNAYVPSYLLRERLLPDELPDYVGFGDESEAVACVSEQIAAWLATPGSLAWLAGSLRPAPTAGRQIARRRRR
ncbi:MAG: tetratricopeptide repeat protein [Dehalococcoidia bacterium]